MLERTDPTRKFKQYLRRYCLKNELYYPDPEDVLLDKKIGFIVKEFLNPNPYDLIYPLDPLNRG